MRAALALSKRQRSCRLRGFAAAFESGGNAAERLATETDSHIAGSIGKIAILYRERDEEPEIKLPV